VPVSDKTRRFAHEYLFPFRGQWHVPWVIHRYWAGAKSGFNLRRMSNAALALLEMKLRRISVRSMPFVLRIEPCNVCNLRCPRCACGTGGDPRPKGFMTLDDYRRVIGANERYGLIVRLDGMGEPTLHPQIFEMIRIAKSRRISVTMHSNLYTDTCDRVDEIIDSGLDRLVVAIDGATQECYEKYRVGGRLDVVVDRLKRISEARKKRGVNRPILEVQFIDFEWNRHERSQMRSLVRDTGADRFEMTAADQTTKDAILDLARPKRCFWLWTVLTIGWNLQYLSCANAWTLPWPRVSFREKSPECFWNSRLMQEARTYNIDKSSELIANDSGSKCNRCYEMLVVPLFGDYFCE